MTQKEQEDELRLIKRTVKNLTKIEDVFACETTKLLQEGCGENYYSICDNKYALAFFESESFLCKIKPNGNFEHFKLDIKQGKEICDELLVMHKKYFENLSVNKACKNACIRQ